MTPEEFKILWKPDELHRWAEFDKEEINKSPISESSKAFLRNGFPLSAAPFLDFGWTSYNNKCVTVAEYYPKFTSNDSVKNYWIIGSDNAGNPICFDISDNDKIVLLDHEQRYEVIAIMNSNIAELASCLLAFKNFAERVQTENGEDAFLDSVFTKAQLADLKSDFERINPNIFRGASYWRSEINRL